MPQTLARDNRRRILTANFMVCVINKRASQDDWVSALSFFNSALPAVPPPLLLSGNASEQSEQIAERRRQSSAGVVPLFFLVADDEPLVRSTIVEILLDAGYDAVGAEDGIEAIACAYRIPPDVFLADVAMPKMNGIEAAKRIKQISPKTRIICFSGHAATSDLLTKAKEQGYDFECLAKPVKPEALIRAIQGMTI